MHHLILLLTAAALAACGAERQPGELFGPEEAEVLVVDAVLVVGQPLPEVYVRRTASPRSDYSAAAAAVTGAQVAISQGDVRHTYRPDPQAPGRYLPPEGAPRVEPRTAYALEVRAAGESLRARTRTPDRVRIAAAALLDEKSLVRRRELVLFGGADDPFAAAANQLHYLDGLLELEVEETDAAGYQVALFSLDEGSDFVIDADFLEAEDYEGFERQGASPPVALESGRVRLPWFAVAFAGRHVFRVYAVDENWFDYARTSSEDGSFLGGLAGDRFERPLFRVEGGIGLFGSAAVDSLGFNLLPRLPE
ncbi:MAG: DUF4249 family protein [Gemmatimonadota bacterium]